MTFCQYTGHVEFKMTCISIYVYNPMETNVYGEDVYAFKQP